MADQKRLLELALKGLEAEQQRIDEEIADIRKQIHGDGQRSRTQSGPQLQASPQPQSAGRPARTGSRLTPAGRKKLSDMMKRQWAAKKRAATRTKTKCRLWARKSQAIGELFYPIITQLRVERKGSREFAGELMNQNRRHRRNLCYSSAHLLRL